MSSLSHQGTPDNSNDLDPQASTKIGEERQQHGPSQYELRREANIAENQRLLASLGLLGGGSNALRDKSPTNKGKKGQEKGYVLCLLFQL